MRSINNEDDNDFHIDGIWTISIEFNPIFSIVYKYDHFQVQEQKISSNVWFTEKKKKFPMALSKKYFAL